MLLDEIAPDFDKKEVHQMVVGAPADGVYDAVWRLDLNRSAVVRNLFRLRGLPPSALTLRGLVDLGFNVLADERPRELVLGLAGKFWTRGPELPELDAASFRALDDPGVAKASWNFLIEPLGEDRCRLRTETRVECTDPASKRRFAAYWLFIRPFSGWVRRVMLKIIKEDAERTAGSPITS